MIRLLSSSRYPGDPVSPVPRFAPFLASPPGRNSGLALLHAEPKTSKELATPHQNVRSAPYRIIFMNVPTNQLLSALTSVSSVLSALRENS